jgi:hypothetical protein
MKIKKAYILQDRKTKSYFLVLAKTTPIAECCNVDYPIGMPDFRLFGKLMRLDSA